ncbi:MAG: hypothetical protein HUU57_04640 [Bdellovibrio sp.]|nr:hypothetical protein [Bdellovibrio sp.]
MGMNRRNFIRLFGFLGLGTVIGSDTVAHDDMAEPVDFSIKIQLPQNMSFNDYKNIRNKKMNYQLFMGLEKEFQKKGKITSKEFSFSGNEALLNYSFKSESARDEYVSHLLQKFPNAQTLASNNSIELKFQVS